MNVLIGSGDDIVCTGFLISRYEVRVVDGRKRFSEVGHVRCDLTLKVIVQDLSTLHGFIQRNTGYIPASKDEIIGVYHGEDVGDRNMNFLSRTRFGSNAHGRSAKKRSDIVGLLEAGFSVPNDVVTVGENGGA